MHLAVEVAEQQTDLLQHNARRKVCESNEKPRKRAWAFGVLAVEVFTRNFSKNE